MRTIVKTELLKLKRYHIIWAGIALMLLSVLLTLFTSMANDGSVWDFRYLIEQVIKNNMSMIFPMCIALIAGYIISREEKDDVLKNIITIPISFKKLLVGKLIVCAMLSILFGLICTIFTLIAGAYDYIETIDNTRKYKKKIENLILWNWYIKKHTSAKKRQC